MGAVLVLLSEVPTQCVTVLHHGNSC
jgi:hypothetical protein